MNKFREKGINRPAIATSILLVGAAVGLLFWDQNRVSERANNSEAVWTVTMEKPDTSYTFRGPLGMFLIHQSLVTSYRNLTANVDRLTMQWHYKSGKPWWPWVIENDINGSYKKEIELGAVVTITPPNYDTSASAKEVYLDDRLYNTDPTLVPKSMGMIWNNTVRKYQGHSTTYYLIEDRMPYDGRVIICREGAFYCRLRGARVTDTLSLDSVTVWKEDVINWKQYQNKAQTLIRQAIVD